MQSFLSKPSKQEPKEFLSDANGFVVGQWKASLCGCFAHVVPNCLMAFVCPCVSLGQTMARLGSSGTCYMLVYGLLLLFSGGVNVLLFVLAGMQSESIVSTDATDDNPIQASNDSSDSGTNHVLHVVTASLSTVTTAFLLGQARAIVRRRFEIPGNILVDGLLAYGCPCCVLAQMATHVDAYSPNECRFQFKATLPAYAEL
ncbi:Aste57867_10782 [Aphanomyces stellatus]|uniref:Aste57867_10782 protein n=1 Tax=Aphanomyces stellatus TaxID=120398 RepID=A0A485KR92_9STRA|nr:hypothetical protein As57867_010742 [Aphanomyces stellatus]VFT87652.1 Aste57867_10782 [Aphanomyces stellatus]